MHDLFIFRQVHHNFYNASLHCELLWALQAGGIIQLMTSYNIHRSSGSRDTHVLLI